MGIKENPKTIKELLNTKFPEQQWIVERLIPANSITIMSAEPNSYKTYMLLEIALKATQGELLFNQFETQPARVLMVDEDNGEWLLNKRLKQLGAAEDLPIYYYSYDGFLVKDGQVTTLLEKCKELDINLVMIDCLARIHTSDENVAADMSALFRQLRRLTVKGITVILTHHNRKPGSNQSNARHDMRGSSDILASVDCHIAIRRDDQLLTVEQTKQRYALELKPFDLRVSEDPDTFGFEYLGSTEEGKNSSLKEAILSLLAEHGKLFQKEILELLTKAGVEVNKPKLSKILKVMVKAGEVSSSKGTGNTKYYSLPPKS